MDPTRAPIEELKAVSPERLVINAVPGQACVDSGGMHPPTSGLWKERPWETNLSQSELNELLENAHILVFTLPYPKHLLNRMPNLMYAQYLFAGISDLRYSDLWGSHVKVGSARGFVDTLPIAEMVIGACFYFSKNLGIATNQTRLGEFDAKAYNLKLISNKTIAIIGLGGIGQEIARLAKLLGMRVYASKRSTSERLYDVENVDVLFPPSDLKEPEGTEPVETAEPPPPPTLPPPFPPFPVFPVSPLHRAVCARISTAFPACQQSVIPTSVTFPECPLSTNPPPVTAPAHPFLPPPAHRA